MPVTEHPHKTASECIRFLIRSIIQRKLQEEFEKDPACVITCIYNIAMLFLANYKPTPLPPLPPIPGEPLTPVLPPLEQDWLLEVVDKLSTLENNPEILKAIEEGQTVSGPIIDNLIQMLLPMLMELLKKLIESWINKK